MASSSSTKGTVRWRDHTVLEFAYQVPRGASHYFIRRTDRNWLVAAFSGLLWVNPTTDELERLTVGTSELPPETGACTAETRVDYQNVRLGTGGFLLPLESELRILLRDGTESENFTKYSNCHEYVAQSTLSFAEPSTTTEPQAVLPPPESARIPNGLPVTLALTSPIDTDTAAAGDAISARVTHDVLAPRSSIVVIPAGAVVRGRILRMEHRRPTPHFLISVSWSKIEDRHGVKPFFARIDQKTDLEQARAGARFLGKRTTVWLPPPSESKRAGGWFIFPTSKNRYDVPAGYFLAQKSASAWIATASFAYVMATPLHPRPGVSRSLRQCPRDQEDEARSVVHSAVVLRGCKWDAEKPR